jgi:hypothetical protein
MLEIQLSMLILFPTESSVVGFRAADLGAE